MFQTSRSSTNIRRLVGGCGIMLAMLASGCASDGRELGVPRSPDLAGIVPATSADLPLVQTGPSGMQITSPAFAAGAAMPNRYAATDLNLSPPLTFSSPPINTSEFAVVVRNPDSGFVHWLVTGIDASFTGLPEGAVAPEAFEHSNDADSIGWVGPDTTEGAKGRLQFELYALSEPLQVDDENQAALLAQLQTESIGRAAFVSRFGSA